MGYAFGTSILKKIQFHNPFAFRVYIAHLFLVLLLILTYGVGFAVKSSTISNLLPLRDGEPVMIAADPSPIASPSPVSKLNPGKTIEKAPVQTQARTNTNSTNKNALCRDVTEDWKLVADPEKEGLYIICNAQNQEMATVDGLNAAQNTYRAGHGLNTLSINSALCKVAAERAKEVAVNFSHDGFEAAIERSGVEKNSFGENIASGPLSSVQFIEWSWDKSPGHRANMLGDWSDGCAGVHDRYAVFLFAK